MVIWVLLFIIIFFGLILVPIVLTGLVIYYGITELGWMLLWIIPAFICGGIIRVLTWRVPSRHRAESSGRPYR
jgi:hypothetical protein